MLRNFYYKSSCALYVHNHLPSVITAKGWIFKVYAIQCSTCQIKVTEINTFILGGWVLIESHMSTSPSSVRTNKTPQLALRVEGTR